MRILAHHVQAAVPENGCDDPAIDPGAQHFGRRGVPQVVTPEDPVRFASFRATSHACHTLRGRGSSGEGNTRSLSMRRTFARARSALDASPGERKHPRFGILGRWQECAFAR